jgi:peptide subunit release factor 1 (eRF1)
MATNPVERIRRRIYPTQMQRNLANRLRALAELPANPDTPYLTVSLDWRPEGSDPEYRGGLQRFEHEANEIRDSFGPRGPIFDSLGEDIQRIRTYLEETLEPSSKGVFFVSNSGQGVFEASPLGLPIPTRISCGPIPMLFHLAELVETHPTYAVLVASQQQAMVSVITQGHRLEELDLLSSDYPRKQQTGGWSQRRLQQRADERILALARDLSDATEHFLERRGIDMLILAGDEPVTSALNEVMSEHLQARIIETVRLDERATEQQIVETTLPIIERAEHEREAAAVDRVGELVGGGKGVASGSQAVLEALVNGQVSELIMVDDYHEDGWADFENNRHGVADSRDVFGHADEEFDLVPIALEEEMVRLALLTSAEIDIISSAVPVEYDNEGDIPETGEDIRSPAAKELDNLGGVAALLRFEIED